MLRRKLGGFLAIVGELCTKLTKPRLLPLADRGLRREPAQDQAPGRVDPVIRERVKHLTPNSLLERIEVGRRRRTPATGDTGNDGEGGGGSARHRRGAPEADVLR